MRAEVTADLLYLYVDDQPVPPVGRSWVGAAWSIRVNHYQNVHLLLQTEGDTYIITVLIQVRTTHIVIGPEAVTAVPDPFCFLNAAMSCLCTTLPKA